MKVYYRKMKKVSRESEEHRLEPIGPWRLVLGGSLLSLDLAESQESKVAFLLPIENVLPAGKNNSELLPEK